MGTIQSKPPVSDGGIQSEIEEVLKRLKTKAPNTARAKKAKKKEITPRRIDKSPRSPRRMSVLKGEDNVLSETTNLIRETPDKVPEIE